jgi:hypothetical protein
VGAPLRDTPGARRGGARRLGSGTVPARAGRQGGRDSPGASSGTVVDSDIGKAQGQSRREQGGAEG